MATPASFFLRTAGTLTLTVLLSTAPAHARFACELVFQTQTAATLHFVKEDAYQQWMLWEQTANFAPFVKPTEAFILPVSHLPRAEIKVDYLPELPKEFLDFTFGSGAQSIRMVQHPYNKSTTVPYLNAAHVESIQGYFTASRSVVLDGAFRGLTIKLPTDHPHGLKGEHQPGKADTADDVRSALLHSNHLKDIDSRIGKDDELIILPEIMTIADAKSLVGVVVRDVRAMDSGHYYLPALSIPYVGRQIAEMNGQSFGDFWNKNYAEILGRAKAKMLLRYGLQMETPNSQNMLIQFDRNMKPTGRIVFRDVSDAVFVDVVGKGLGFEKQIEIDKSVTFDPHNYLQPFWSNSSWRFNEAGKDSVSGADLARWEQTHNSAYENYIGQQLGLRTQGLTKRDRADDLYKLLGSDVGQQQLRAYQIAHQALPMRTDGTIIPATTPVVPQTTLQAAPTLRQRLQGWSARLRQSFQ